MMHIGKLKFRIELRRSAETGRETSGEPILSWSTYATVWGQMEDLSGREFFAAQQVNSEINKKITVRYRNDIRTTDVARVGNQDFNIIAMLDRTGERRWLQLMCVTQQHGSS